eukprot:972112-Pyramimonas_sp.AAC.1
MQAQPALERKSWEPAGLPGSLSPTPRAPFPQEARATASGVFCRIRNQDDLDTSAQISELFDMPEVTRSRAGASTSSSQPTGATTREEGASHQRPLRSISAIESATEVDPELQELHEIKIRLRQETRAHWTRTRRRLENEIEEANRARRHAEVHKLLFLLAAKQGGPRRR